MKAILSKTTTDLIKSKMLSPELSQMVFDVYIRPDEFAKIVDKYFDKEFNLEIKDEQG